MNDEIAEAYKFLLYTIFGEKLSEDQWGPASAEDVEALDMALVTLSEREERLLKARFGILNGSPKTLDEIAEMIEITRDEVVEIESNAINKMRHPARSQTLRPFLEDE